MTTTISFTCPHCGHHTDVDPQYAGRTGPCVGCANSVTIPSLVDHPETANLRAMPADERPWWIKTGIVLGGMVALGVLGLAAMAVFQPAFEAAREAARRTACQTNLRRIGMAIEEYYSEKGHYPPAVVFDEQGNPMHSWRVLILPYLGPDAQQVHELYDMAEAWDGPNNSKLVNSIPNAYRCPSDVRATIGETSYLAVVGPETIINTDRPARREDIRDIYSETMVVIETASSAMNWLQPRDVHVDQLRAGLNSKNANGPGSNHVRGTNVLMADGSVVCLPATTSGNDLRGMATTAGNEYIEALDELDF